MKKALWFTFCLVGIVLVCTFVTFVWYAMNVPAGRGWRVTVVCAGILAVPMLVALFVLLGYRKSTGSGAATQSQPAASASGGATPRQPATTASRGTTSIMGVVATVVVVLAIGGLVWLFLSQGPTTKAQYVWTAGNDNFPICTGDEGYTLFPGEHRIALSTTCTTGNISVLRVSHLNLEVVGSSGLEVWAKNGQHVVLHPGQNTPPGEEIWNGDFKARSLKRNDVLVIRAQ